MQREGKEREVYTDATTRWICLGKGGEEERKKEESRESSWTAC